MNIKHFSKKKQEKKEEYKAEYYENGNCLVYETINIPMSLMRLGRKDLVITVDLLTWPRVEQGNFSFFFFRGLANYYVHFLLLFFFYMFT